MRATLIGVLVVVGAFASGAPVAADTAAPVFQDIDGDWHFRFYRGAMVLHFGAPRLGVFTASGAAYSTLFDTTFTLSSETPQTLQYASDGRIHGVLALEDAAHESQIGTFTVQRGRLNATKDHLVLKGSLALNGRPTRNVSILGDRIGATAPISPGRTFDGSLAGRGVRSTKFDTQFLDAGETASVGSAPALTDENYPFFYLYAGGPVRVAGAEKTGVEIKGLVAVDTHGLLFGRVVSNEFGPGTLSGAFVANPLDATLPSFTALIRFDSRRHLSLSGRYQTSTKFK
jgi:hypothetical protein